MSKTIYWITKEGTKIDVDEMSIEHLRNTLKMLIRKQEKKNEELSDLWHEFHAEDYGDRSPD